MTPRAWQAAALPKTIEAVRARKRALVSAATGSGKSVLLAELSALAIAKGGSVVVVAAPRQVLVRQLAETIGLRAGAGLVGQFYADTKQVRPITVTCFDSLPALLDELPASTARGLIVDEAHQSERDDVRNFAAAWAPTWTVGFSATPWRTDPRERLSLFDEVVFRYTLAEALHDKVLVPPGSFVNGVFQPWLIEGCRVAVDDVDTEIVRFCREAEGPGCVSAQSILDAEAFAARVGGVAIHSDLPDSQKRIAAWKAGAFRIAVDVRMLGEGVDFPGLRWLVLRRPTATRLELVQRIGRVLRTAPGKNYARVFDPHDLLGAYGLGGEAALGHALETLGEAPPRPKKGKATEVPPMPPGRAVDAATAWARAILLQLHAAGLATGAVPTFGRSMPADRGQLRRLNENKRPMTWYARYLPEPLRKPVRALAEAPGLSAGCAADLLAVLEVAKEQSADSRASWGPYRRPGMVPHGFRFPDVELPVLEEGVVKGLQQGVAA